MFSYSLEFFISKNKIMKEEGNKNTAIDEMLQRISLVLREASGCYG